MNPSDFIEKYGLGSLEELPADARARLEADSELLTAYQAQRDVVQMLGLKRYENPSHEMDLCGKVRARIEQGDFPADESSVINFPMLRWGLPALAAALIAVFGISIFLRGPSDLGASSSPEMATVDPTSPKMEVVHLDSFTTVPTSVEALPPELLIEMRETALAAELALHGSRTNQHQSNRFLLPAMQEVSNALPALPQVDTGAIEPRAPSR